MLICISLLSAHTEQVRAPWKTQITAMKAGMGRAGQEAREGRAGGGFKVRRTRLPRRAEDGEGKGCSQSEKGETGRELVVKDHRVQSNGLH